MKHLRLLSALLSVVLLSACGIESRQEQVRSSLGPCERIAFYSSGGFQDYTDFGIYRCPDAELKENPYFAPLTEEDTETLSAFLDDFENWIEVIQGSDPGNEVVVNYSFDRSIVDTGDWLYIYEGENYPKFGCYDIWLFDSQSGMLYYFHNNI